MKHFTPACHSARPLKQFAVVSVPRDLFASSTLNGVGENIELDLLLKIVWLPTFDPKRLSPSRNSDRNYAGKVAKLKYRSNCRTGREAGICVFKLAISKLG